MTFPFAQVDVFSHQPLKGNPLAVVSLDQPIPEEQMQSLAAWTNLSETVFLLPPQVEGADYSLRIFTPLQELPFAGHPTIGAAAVWLARGQGSQSATIVQHCPAGLIELRVKDAGRIAFKAPDLTRSGPVEAELAQRILHGTGLSQRDVVDLAWVDNGPGWIALQVASVDQLYAIRPDYAAFPGQRVGVYALSPGSDAAYHVRAFSASGFEDPVTGSLHAGIAAWTQSRGLDFGPTWVGRQGHCVSRDGCVHVTRAGDTIWVGGDVCPVISGTISL